VRDVGGFQAQQRHLAHWHMQLIGSHHVQLGIAEFPPPLVSDDGDLQRVRGRAMVLDGRRDAGSGHHQYEDDQNRDHGPGDLNLIAAVNLSRLGAFAAATVAKADDGVGDQSRYHCEDDSANRERQDREMVDRLSRSRQRLEDVADRMNFLGAREAG
jgi:hypothetical protein